MEKQSDWEDHLQLLLFAYQTTQHSTTRMSPYEVLFRQNPQLPSPPTTAFSDPGDYSDQLQRKLLKMWEMVEANTTESAQVQKKNYPGRTCNKPFTIFTATALKETRNSKSMTAF